MTNTNLNRAEVYWGTEIETELWILMDKVERLNKHDSPENLISSINIDGRWNDNTIPDNIRKKLLEAGYSPNRIKHLTNETILKIVHQGQEESKKESEDKFLEELQAMNSLIKIKRG